MKRLFIISGLIFFVTILMLTSKVNDDPFYESFFQKTRLIMSKEEIHIYKHLPDKEAKEEFIKDFWKKRDPDPDTDENEVKEEFAERIEYANRWFREGRGKDSGWDTQRGRILLQLGFPDERHWGVLPSADRRGNLKTTKRYPMEMWLYYKLELQLIFTGDFEGSAVFKLVPHLGTMERLHEALEKSKFQLDLGLKGPRLNEFRFKASYKNDEMVIKIPVKRISFEKKDGKMSGQFRVEVSVYEDYKKIETIRVEKTISKDEDELLKTKNIEFTVPYSPPGKGKYFFDIIIEEEGSSSKYRNCFKHKFRS
ncbi:GWxTD domain-containing protein [Acidobacteriota bacterium]